MDQHDQKSGEDAFRVCSLIALWINVLVTAFLTFYFARSRIAFLKIFQDFGAPIPESSVLVLSPWFLGILPTLAIVGIVKERLLPSRRATLVWNGLQLAAAPIIWQLYVIGVWEPVEQLVEKLSGGG